MNKKVFLCAALLFFILWGLGYLAAFNKLDPDFGWHLRTGELIPQKGVPKIDWYSYTMPNFLWIDHEWLTDLFIAKIFSAFGFNVLLLGFLAIASLTFIFRAKLKSFFYFIIPILLGFLAILPFLGIRPQLITLFFIAILLKILNNFLEKPDAKIIYLSPILFLFWVNLHGGFFAGIFILFLFLILELLKNSPVFQRIFNLKFFQGQKSNPTSKKKITTLLIALVFSSLATLINPYGIRIYEEIFRSISDIHLGWYIAEWLPLFSTGTPVFGILYLSLFLGLLLPQYKKIEFNNLALAVVFLIFGILHQRHYPVFIILTIPIFAELIFYFRQAVNPQAVKLLLSGYKKWLAFVFLFGLFGWGLYPYIVSAIKYNPLSFYPEEALDFLKKIPPSENIFNEYDWGGYLIWKLPDRKFFIDGRMPSWKQNGHSAFKDYIKVMKGKKVKDVFLKYNITVALFKKNQGEKQDKIIIKNEVANFFQKHSWLAKILGLDIGQNNIYQELINSGWKIAYEDETAVIIKK